MKKKIVGGITSCTSFMIRCPSWLKFVSPRFSALSKHVPNPTFEEFLGRDGSEQLHDPGDDSGPPRLVACPQPGPVVTVEVLVEQKVVPPLRVGLELLGASMDGT